MISIVITILVNIIVFLRRNLERCNKDKLDRYTRAFRSNYNNYYQSSYAKTRHVPPIDIVKRGLSIQHYPIKDEDCHRLHVHDNTH